MGHRLKARRYKEDIEKTEHSIAALQEHLRRVKLQLAAIEHLPSSQCDTDAVARYSTEPLPVMETFLVSFFSFNSILPS